VWRWYYPLSRCQGPATFYLMVDASDTRNRSSSYAMWRQGYRTSYRLFLLEIWSAPENYSTIEEEALALLLALQHFNVYLNITVISQPSCFRQWNENNNQCLLWWNLLFQKYNLKIYNVHGKDNVIADTLSTGNFNRVIGHWHIH